MDEARNELVVQALALDPLPKYVLWVDDDAFWFKGTIPRLIDGLESQLSPETAIITAKHGDREPDGFMYAWQSRDGYLRAMRSVPNSDAPHIVRCDMIGMHVRLHRTELLSRVGPNPFSVRDADRAESAGGCRFRNA